MPIYVEYVTGWKKDRRYGKRVFKLQEGQSLLKFTWSKIFRFFISQEHILSNFKHFLKQNSIKSYCIILIFWNSVISFLFPPGHQNILAISLWILFPCNFPCNCLNFLLQGNFLASGSPGRPGVNYDVIRTSSAVYKITLSRRSARGLEDVTATFARRRWNVNMFAG